MWCSFDNAEVYAGGKAEEVMGQAIKVSLIVRKAKQTHLPTSVCFSTFVQQTKHSSHMFNFLFKIMPCTSLVAAAC